MKRVKKSLPARPWIVLILFLCGLMAGSTTQAAPGDPVYGWGSLGPGLAHDGFTLALGAGGTLYASSLDISGGVGPNYLARWEPDESTWDILSDSVVHTLAFDWHNDLYVGGQFTTVGIGPGAVSAQNIAKYDTGSLSWSPLGPGVNTSVYALALDPAGDLYVGGTFSTAGGSSANHIAKWDPGSSAWSPLGSGTDSNVYALAADVFGHLYIGGTFSSAGGTPANHVAKWDPLTSAWSPLGAGTNSSVYALTSDPAGNLYVGGLFSSAGGIPANNIAKWDPVTSNWEPLGSGVNHAVFSLALDPAGNLYAGGNFDIAGGIPANNIAKWNHVTSNWEPLGSGVNGPVLFGLDSDSAGNIYLGGSFTSAGGQPASHIAVYGIAPEVAPGGVNSIPDTGDGVLSEGELVTTGLQTLIVAFTMDLFDPPADFNANDVTNPANYSLIKDGATPIPINGVSYDNHGGGGPYLATVQINNGVPLPDGDYTFTINGSSSIVNQLRIRLAGNGVISGSDFIRSFTVGASLPKTGFAPNQRHIIPGQPREKAYTALGSLWLEIPKLGQQLPITGIPRSSGTWDVTWLGGMVGYLEGTAFPTWKGNTVLTAHVWDAWNRPGPFVNLKSLTYGDPFTIHFNGLAYTYQVRENHRIDPDDPSPLEHAEEDLVTLLTCEGFNIFNGQYRFRRMVRGVLVSIALE